ncbi:YfiH family protein [Arthrobacter roseus]|nr:YfiH family protein [Arthrobacter roseus]
MSGSSAPSGSAFDWMKNVGNGLSVGFTGVEAGNLAMNTGADADADAVVERRRRLEQRIGAGAGELKFMHQTHSTTVVAVDRARGDLRADALMSTDGKTPLAVMVADCLPVLLAGRTHKGWATAAVHAGRVGLLGGILPNAVAQMRGAGAHDIQAWIGPAICGACYEVPS